MNKAHGVELPSLVFPTCREPGFPYLMEYCYDEKLLNVASFDILAFFQAAIGSNWLIVVLSTASPGINRSHKYKMRIPDNRWPWGNFITSDGTYFEQRTFNYSTE